MKLNKIFTIATLAASALFATSCSDDVPEYAGPGAWDANANYANVYFQTSSVLDNLDPAEPTEKEVKVYRRVEHKYTWGKDKDGNDSIIGDQIVTPLPAVTVKPTVKENQDNVFSVSDAQFAEGDSVAIVKVTFPDAVVGTTYKLVIALEGADYVSSYSKDTAFTYTVTRVKWNSIGTGKFTDAFWFEDSWEVEIMQRDDDKSYYRIMDPFGAYASLLDGSQSEYLELHVLKKGDMISGVAVTESDIVDWYRLSTGYVHSSYGEVVWAINAKNFTNYASMDYYTYNRVSARLDDGSVGQIQLAPYWYMFGVGGWNYLEEPTIFINFPGFVEEYTATLDDYEWEPVFAGEFTSEQLGTKKDGVMLYKGVPNDSIEEANSGCYERYVAKAGGTPYVISSPYANGNNLYFIVKNSNIAPLVDGTYDFTYQNTGLTALNQKVYAHILASSKFADDLVSLDIQFQTLPNRAGEFIDYGTSTEILANITWTKVGTGTFSYTGWWSSDEQDEEGNYLPLVDPGYELYQRDGSDNTYKITNWGAGVDYIFKWDKNTNVCATQLGSIGESHPSYGEVYVVDASSYSSRYTYEDYPSQYVPGENTFYFFNAYVVEAGSFGVFLETFQVDWDADAAGARSKSLNKSKRVASMRPNKNIKAASRFVGKPAKAAKYGRSLGTPKNSDKLIAE